MTDLNSYDLPELEALAERIKAEIAKREREEEEARQAALDAAAAAEVERAAAAERVAAAERAAAEQAAREAAAAAAARQAQEDAERAAKAAAAVRYMHPSNRALTWTGVGPMPDWVHAWLVTGGTLYALEIAAEKLAPRPIPDSLRPR